MDEKMFNLLEKMYIEMQGVKDEVQKIKGEMQEMKDEMQEMKINMATKQDIVRLENKMDENHKALYDGYKQSIEGITEIRQKLNKLTDRVDNQEIKLQVLKSTK